MKVNSKLKLGMLGYCKIILEKFTFDKALFRKEYSKNLKMLPSHERKEFRRWAWERFGQTMFSLDR